MVAERHRRLGAGHRAVRECRRRTRRWRRPRRAARHPPGRELGGPVLQRHVRHVVPRRRLHRRRQCGVAHPDEPVRRRGDRAVDVRHRVGRIVAVGVPRLPDPAALGEGDPDRRTRRPGRAGHRRRGHHDERADRARAGPALPRRRTARLRGHARRTGSAGPVLVRRRRTGRRHHRDVRDLQPDRRRRRRRRRVPRPAGRSELRWDPDDHRSRRAGWSCSTRPTSSTPGP